jgi:hypothetical protein
MLSQTISFVIGPQGGYMEALRPNSDQNRKSPHSGKKASASEIVSARRPTVIDLDQGDGPNIAA